MGRPKKPTLVKALEGNPGKRPLPMNEYRPAPIAGNCPEWLSDSAKDIWNTYAPKLEKGGMLTEVDGLDFQNLCIQAGLLRDAYEKLKIKKDLIMTTPNMYEIQRPEISIINTCTRNIATLSAKFGMSPSDRVGLTDPKANTTKTKLSGLLSG